MAAIARFSHRAAAGDPACPCRRAGRRGGRANLSVMKIELLYFDGCPSHEAFLPRLHELLAQAQAQVPAPIEQRRVESAAAAERERFLGSPTLRVDGVDIDPGARVRSDYGLKCRLYPTEQGPRGVPPDEWVLNALQQTGRPTG